MVSIADTYKPAPDPAHVIDFPPAIIDKRTDATPLTRLGTSIMEFPVAGTTDPWQLHYEETVYVVAGHIEIDIVTGSSDHDAFTITGEAGDVLALPQATTVRYRGTAGTRLVLSITPVNWRDLVTDSADTGERA